MSRNGVLGDMEIIDNYVNDLRLRQLDLAIVLLLDVDSRIILDVSLALNIQPCSLNLLYCLVYGP